MAATPRIAAKIWTSFIGGIAIANPNPTGVNLRVELPDRGIERVAVRQQNPPAHHRASPYTQDSPPPKNRMNFPLIAALLALAPLVATAWGIDTAKWTEEVKQGNGTALRLKRESRIHSSGFPVSRRGAELDYKVKYEPMQLTWEGPQMHPPIAFEIVDGTPILVLLDADGRGCQQRSADSYTVTVLSWTAGMWKEVPQDKAPLDKVHKNLLGWPWGGDSAGDAHGLITLQNKNGLEGGNAYLPLLDWLKRGPRTCGQRSGSSR